MNESFNSISLFFNKILNGKSNSSISSSSKDLCEKMPKSSKKNSKNGLNDFSDKTNNSILTTDNLNGNKNEKKIKLNYEDSLKKLELIKVEENFKNLNETLNENNLKVENNSNKLENFDNFLINGQNKNLSINSNKLDNLKNIKTNTFETDHKNSLIGQNETCSLVNLNDQQVRNNSNEELIIDCLTLVNDFDYSKNDLFNLNDQLILKSDSTKQMLTCDEEKQLPNLNKDDLLLSSNSNNEMNDILQNEVLNKNKVPNENKVLNENVVCNEYKVLNKNDVLNENKKLNKNLNEDSNKISNEKINKDSKEDNLLKYSKQTNEKLICGDQLPKNFIPPALYDKKDFEEINLNSIVNEENFEVIENEDVKQDCLEIAQLYPKSAKIFFQKSNKNDSNDKSSKLKSSLFSVMKIDKNKYNSLDKSSKNKKYKEEINSKLNNSKSDNIISREIDIDYFDINNKFQIENSGKIKKSSSFSSTASVATTSSLDNQTNKNEIDFNYSLIDTNKKELNLFCNKNEKFYTETELTKVNYENNFKNCVSDKFINNHNYNENISENPPIPPPRAISNKIQKNLRESCSTENLKKVNNYNDKILNENSENVYEENSKLNYFKEKLNGEKLDEEFYKRNLKNKLTIKLQANEIEQNNFSKHKSELNNYNKNYCQSNNKIDSFNKKIKNFDLNIFKTNNGLWPNNKTNSFDNLDKINRSNSVKQLNWKKENFLNTQNQLNKNQNLNSNFSLIKDLQIKKSNTMFNLDVSKKIDNFEYKKMINSLKDSIQNLEKSFKKNIKKNNEKPKILNFNQKIIFETKENTFKPVIDNCILDVSSTSSSSCSLCSSISSDSLETLDKKEETFPTKSNSLCNIKTFEVDKNSIFNKKFLNYSEIEPKLSLIKSLNTRSLSNLTYSNLNNRRLFKTSSGLFCPFRELSRIDESLDDEQNLQELKDNKLNDETNNFDKNLNKKIKNTNFISSLDNLHGLDNFTTNSPKSNNIESNTNISKTNNFTNASTDNLAEKYSLNSSNNLEKSNLIQKIEVTHQNNDLKLDNNLENTLTKKIDFLIKNSENKISKNIKIEETKIKKLDESYELNEDREIIEIFDNKENSIKNLNKNKLLLMNTNSCKSFEQNEKIVELESQLNSFKTKFDDSLNVIKILTDHCNDLIDVFNQKYNIKVNEIDLLNKENKYLTKLNNELKIENINLNETCDDLKKHLNETELNEQKFNFYEEKYSKIKNALDYSRENEQQLSEELNNLKIKFQQNYELYEKVKTRAIEKVQSANEMIESANKTNDRELILTKMQLKKAEYKIAKLENDLDLKIKENHELSQLLNNLES